MAEHYMLDPSEIFTIFFVMLGPLKMLGAFAKATQKLTQEELHRLALRATGFALIALTIGGFVGAKLLQLWKVPVPILALTTGLIFLLTALILILGLKKNAASALPEHCLTAPEVVYSMIVTPYGMAVIIALLAISGSLQRTLLILGLLLGVMILNWLSMTFIRQIMGKVGTMILQMLGAVLGILQASLAMFFAFSALKELKDLW